MIRKILTIGEDQIRSGISVSPHLTKNGLWSKAVGVNPFLGIFPTYGGVLQTSGSPVDITSTVVVDSILDAVARFVSGSHLYMLGSAGHFYDKDLSNNNAPTDLRSGTPISSPANGVEIFKPNGGTEYLYYWQLTQIGRWDLSGTYPTGWVDNQYTGLTSSAYHKPHKFNGNCYYLNKDKLGALLDDLAGGVIHSTNVLDWPSEYVGADINDDGTYLVVAVSEPNTDSLQRCTIKIYFWDTTPNTSWNREWTISDSWLVAIKKFGDGFLAICANGVYYFDFYTRPKFLYPLGGTTTLNAPQSVENLNDQVMLPVTNSDNTFAIGSYGKQSPDDKTAFRVPYAGFAGTVNYIDNKTGVFRFFVGTSGPTKLYYVQIAGSGQTGLQPAETIYIPLGNQYKITAIDVVLVELLASGDICTVTLYQQGGDNINGAFTDISFAKYGAIKKLTITGNLIADELKIVLGYTGGNVRIKSLTFYGEPHNQKYK